MTLAKIMLISAMISICCTSTLVLLAVRIIGVIEWSWWWVLSPLWLMGLACIGMMIVQMKKDRRRFKPPWEQEG